MFSQRLTHYWLWFLLFAVVSALITGFLGLVLGLFVPALVRPFVLLIGGALHRGGLARHPERLWTESRAVGVGATQRHRYHGHLRPESALCANPHGAGLTSLSHALRARVAVAAPALE
jgi:hypothetical protein